MDQLELCATKDVGFSAKTTLLEQVELIHQALPELELDEIQTATQLLGKPLRAPIVIAAMTGGTAQAEALNRELASIAESRGYGFGLGSQRPMLQGRHEQSYMVRSVAPNCLLLGNLSGVQARDISTDQVAELVAKVGADGLCVHLNPAMELIQPEGDRDFGGVAAALARLSQELPFPVVAKETGCGIGWPTAKKLAELGVRHVDVSGAGGTSWIGVETLRTDGATRQVGETLRDWGVPTAASIGYAVAAQPAFETVIATGGMATGLDIARAIALGADAAGFARPVLKAHRRGGRQGVEAFFLRLEAELRAVMLLVGAANVAELKKAPKLVGPELDRWLDQP